jgi:DNA-directed RNA polymerase alpha subunit
MENGVSSYDKEPIAQDSCYYRMHSCHHSDCDGNSMSGPIEIINPRTMSCTLMEDGVVLATYKVEQCDKCSKLVKFDEFGYQKGYGNEKIIWFCWECR